MFAKNLHTMANIHTDSIGGGFGGFGGGFGGGGILEGLLLGALFNRNGNGGLFGNGTGGSPDLDASGIAAKVVELQNSANVLKEVQGLGNEIQSAFSIQNLGIQAQFNQTEAAIAAASKEASLAIVAAEINALKTANVLQTNIEALSTKSDAQYSATLQAINADGEKTRALINQNEMNNLRDQLAAERRRSDAREVEINITNSNAQSQNQLQAQLQNQNAVFANLLNPIVDQLARQNQGIVAIGSTLTGTSQFATNANTKVN